MILDSVVPSSSNWLECTMEADQMAADEIYMVLQADMLNIKQQEQALKTEIDSIKSKFLTLLQTCGLENELPVEFNAEVKMTTPQSVEMTPTTTTHRMHYSYADYLIDQLLAQASNLSDSDEDESAIVNNENDMNFNNVDNSCDNSHLVSRQLDNARKLSVLREVNIRVSQTLSEITTSENSVVSSSSDGYPQTTTDESSSENQVVPDMDMEKELVSRMQYYSDFTIDRQRKINTLTTNIINATLRERSMVSDLLDTTECPAISERHVEGCEDDNRSPRSRNIVGCSSTSSTMSTLKKSKDKSSSRNNSHPLASSTMSQSKTSSSSSHSSRSSRSGRSSRSSSRSNSHPLASSTMLNDPSTNIYPNSTTNSESVYTWSLDENTDRVNLEESYLRSKKRCHRRTSRPTSRRRMEQISDFDITNMVSAIATSRTDNFTDSFCEDPDLGYKSQTLPRTSTRACLLLEKYSSSGSSSSDMKTASLPNIPGNNRLNGMPLKVSKSSQVLGSPLRERLELPGKSSTTSESQESAGLEVHPASATQFLASTIYDDCTRVTEMTTDSSLLDSILTDSPKSVDSSGIFAPYNSDATESRGYTTSSVPSSDGNGPRAPPPTPPTIKAPAVAAPIFKVPFSPAARSRSHSRSRHNSSKENHRTSTPLPSSDESIKSEPLRRQLFSPLANSTQIEPKKLDKKALVKRFKKFSMSFYKTDKNGQSQIQTLANL